MELESFKEEIEIIKEEKDDMKKELDVQKEEAEEFRKEKRFHKAIIRNLLNQSSRSRGSQVQMTSTNEREDL